MRDSPHATALKRFKFVANAEHAIRTLELDDQRFAAGNSDNHWQWPEKIWDDRSGKDGQVPARPCLTINKVAAPVAQICNQAREARFAIQVSPKGSKASRDTAKVFQGLIRNCEVESNAQIARIWAFDRALKCGRGFYRVLTKYANDGDSDLDIATERILNQASVYLDPSAQQPDWSDGDWAFITVWMTKERFDREFHDSEAASLDEFSGIGDDAPNWIRGEGDQKEIRIAEYFYAEYKTVEMVDLADGRRVPLLEAKAGVAVLRRSTHRERSIKWCKLNAVEILDQQDWPGRYIPIIPVLADEFNIDGERLFQGITRPAKDAQRSYNYMRSAQVESIGLAPRAPWVMAEGQDEGYEDMWRQANSRNFPSLKYRPVSIGGEMVPPPQRNVVEPAIQSITLAAHEADGDIHATTGVPPVALGDLDPHDRSGKAIKALQMQSDQGSSNYMDNLARAITFEAKIYLDLIPKIYTRQGRIAQILGDRDKSQQVMFNQPFVKGQDGTPQPVPEGTQGATHYDLSDGAQFSVTVDVGKSFNNQREQQVSMMSDLANAAPQLVERYADLWVTSMNIPDGEAIADRVRPQGVEGEDGQPTIPPQVQQAMGQLQQQLQQAVQYIQTDQAKQQGAQQIAQWEIQSKEQIEGRKLQLEMQKAALEAETAIRIEEMKLRGAAMQAEIDSAENVLARQADHQAATQAQAHEAGMAQHGAAVDAAQQGSKQGHEAGMADRGHAQSLEAGEQAHMQTMEQAQQAAKLKPKPKDGASA